MNLSTDNLLCSGDAGNDIDAVMLAVMPTYQCSCTGHDEGIMLFITLGNTLYYITDPMSVHNNREVTLFT